MFSVLKGTYVTCVFRFVPINVPRGFGPMTLTLHVHLLSTIISNDHNHQPLRMSNELSKHQQCTAKEMGWKPDSIIKRRDRTKRIIIQ